jgi:hypothetical protein
MDLFDGQGLVGCKENRFQDEFERFSHDDCPRLL